MKNRGDLRTANLGGRPANEFKLACQAALQKGDAVGFALRLLTGEEQDYYVVDKTLVAGPPRLAMRMEAAKWLADRGFGKATVSIELPPPPVDANLTGEEVRLRVLEMLPVLVRTLPASTAERASLLAGINAAEVVLGD